MIFETQDYGAWQSHLRSHRSEYRGIDPARLRMDTCRWWGDLYELCPDELVAALNAKASYERITALLKQHRATKR